MEEKVYNITKIGKGGNKVHDCKLKAYDIEEAIHGLVRIKEGSKIEVVKEGSESKEIILKYAEAYGRPERYLVEFSHLLKDQPLFKPIEEDEYIRQNEVVHVRYIGHAVVDKVGNGDIVTYGFEFFNQYDSEYSLGMAKEDLVSFDPEDLFEEAEQFLKNAKLKAMITKYNGLYVNDEWLEKQV